MRMMMKSHFLKRCLLSERLKTALHSAKYFQYILYISMSVLLSQAMTYSWGLVLVSLLLLSSEFLNRPHRKEKRLPKSFQQECMYFPGES